MFKEFSKELLNPHTSMPIKMKVCQIKAIDIQISVHNHESNVTRKEINQTITKNINGGRNITMQLLIKDKITKNINGGRNIIMQILIQDILNSVFLSLLV